MHRRTSMALLACLAVFAVVVLAGCYAAPSTPATGGTGATGGGSTGGASAGGNAVTISGFAFSPANLEVKVGTAVTWTNQDSPSHTVTADDGSFKSPSVPTGGTFSFTFTKAGTFKYHCSIHPNMVGQIVVK